MKCRACKRDIPDNSIFCCWCGKEQKKDKTKVSVPKPTRLKSGDYSGQIMVDGERVRVTESTEAKYYASATAVKAGLSDAKKNPGKRTLGSAIDLYIKNNSDVLSPSTLRGYKAHRKTRFPKYIGKKISEIDWQAMINEEAKNKAPKTVRNGWGLVTASLGAIGYPVPDVNLPTVPDPDEPWFDYSQISAFLEALRGEPCEFQALCALHSLRASEIAGLQPDRITKDSIKVYGSVVMDENNNLVAKDTNKTKKSTRTIPIMIPRILEVIPDGDVWKPTHPNTLSSQIRKVCRKAGLPEIACQGLRRTFCSLAYYLGWDEMTTMRIGGWSNIQTVHKHYAKLAEGKKNANIKKMEKFYKKLNYSRITCDK